MNRKDPDRAAESTETKITEEMIAAGMNAFYDCPDHEDPRLYLDEAVQRVFSAMRKLER